MRRRSLTVWLAGVFVTAACTDGPPPLDELGVREALEADPDVVASLPSEARQALGDKMRKTEGVQVGKTEVENASAADDDEATVLALDRARARRGDDALVLATIRRHGEMAQASALSSQDLPHATDVPVGLWIEDPAHHERPNLNVLEERALQGEAGRILADIVRASESKHLVRVVRWPAGVVQIGDTVYVNGSWLVAMSAEMPAPQGTIAIRGIGGTPYSPPSSLGECRTSLANQCEACLTAGSCAPPILRDKGDGRGECTYLKENVERYDALCMIAVMDVESIRACVKRERSNCDVDSLNGSAQVDAAVARLKAEPLCRNAVDSCLASANGRSIGSSGGGGGGSANVCDTSASTSASRKVALLFGPLAFVLLFSRRRRRECASRS